MVGDIGQHQHMYLVHGHLDIWSAEILQTNICSMNIPYLCSSGYLARGHLVHRYFKQFWDIRVAAAGLESPHHAKAVSILSKAIKEILGRRIFPTLGTQGDHYLSLIHI